jgi:hypothetical protein
MPGSSHLWQPRRPPPGRGCFKGYITSREAVVARPCALCGRAQPTQNRVSRRRPNPAAPVLKWRFYMGMSRQESNSGEIRRLAEWPKVGPVAMRVPEGSTKITKDRPGSRGGFAECIPPFTHHKILCTSFLATMATIADSYTICLLCWRSGSCAPPCAAV